MRSRIAVAAVLVSIPLAPVQAATATVHSTPATFYKSVSAPIADSYESPPYPEGENFFDNATMHSFFGEARYVPTAYPEVNFVSGNFFYCSGAEENNNCSGSFLLTFYDTSLSLPVAADPQIGGLVGVAISVLLQDSEDPFVATVDFGDGDVSDFELPQIGFWGITSPDLITAIHFGGPNGAVRHQGPFSLLGLILGGALFTDGFESGSTSGWSATTPQ